MVEAFSGSTCATSVGFHQGDSQLVIANGAYTALAPTRLLDPRSGGGGPLGAGVTRTIAVPGSFASGSVAVPANAPAVALNVTATDTTAGELAHGLPGRYSLAHTVQSQLGPRRDGC